MKIIKSVFILFIAVSFANCSSEEVTPAYPLTLENLVGTYKIKSLSISTDITTISNGISIKVATASTVGNLFKADFDLKSDGTYTMTGSYTIAYKLTPVVGNTVEYQDIIDDVDYSGNYTLNTLNNTITFSGELLSELSGTLNFVTFNEANFSLFQKVNIPDAGNVKEVSTNITFERK